MVSMATHTLRSRLLTWVPLSLLLVLIGPALHAGHRTVGGDGPHMLGISMRLGWLLRTGQWGDALTNWLTLVAPHPPGAYLPPALMYGVLGPVNGVDMWVGLLWLVIVWQGMTRLSQALGNRATQQWVLAVGLAATPLFWQQIDNFGVDLASAAMTIQALSWLVASDGLQNRRAALCAGLWLGGGFWFKYTFPIFLYLPCLLVTVQAVWCAIRRVSGWKDRLVNGVLLTVATVVIVSPMAVVSGHNILNYVLHSATPETSEIVGNLGSSFGPGVSTFDQNAFYFAVLRDLWGWPGVAVLIVGVVVALLQKGARWKVVVSLSSTVGALLVLTDLDIKADRYLTPGLTPVLVIALSAMASHWIRASAAVLVFVAPIVFLWRDYSGWTHGLPHNEVTAFSHVDASRRRAPSGRDFEHLASIQLASWGAWPKVEEPFRPFTADLNGWDLDGILNAMAAQHGRSDGQVGLCLTEQHGTPGFGVFLMKAEQMDLHWDLVTIMVLRGQQGNGAPRTFQFIGPFKRGEDEQYAFDTLFVSYQRGGNSPQRSYLQSIQTDNATVFELPNGMEGQVVEVILPESP